MQESTPAHACSKVNLEPLERGPPLPIQIHLRDVTQSDLPTFFAYQQDPEANRMAAFIQRDPADRDAFDAHWTKILADAAVTIRTIVSQSDVLGHVAVFGPLEEREVTYWIGKQHWGKGIATKSLQLFLEELKERPLYAHAAKDNVASIRVLEKCGFTLTGHDKAFAKARGAEIEEVIMKLE